MSTFVLATEIVLFLFLLKPKFQASRLLLYLYRSVCVRSGWKPRRPVFSRTGSYINFNKDCQKYQRTNGPVNAHLSLLHIPINMFEYYGIYNPSAGADEALGPFSFFRIINILSICQFLAGFSLQMTFDLFFPFKCVGNPC